MKTFLPFYRGISWYIPIILIFQFFFVQNHLLAQSSCATAIPMSVNTQYCGNTQGQPGDFPDDGTAPMNPCDSTINNNEYWFSIVGNGSTSLYFSNMTLNDTKVFVFDDCAGNSPNCLGTSSFGYLSTDILANGVTYYIVVISEDGAMVEDFCLSAELIPCVDGSPCNDFNPCTKDDYWYYDPFNFGICNCEGIPITQGEPCDDGDSLTINDQYDFQCSCYGTPFCEVGTPCDDNDPNTVNDRRVSTDCTCEGTPLPCTIESGLFAKDTIAGCTNPLATNYDPNANYDNGSCELGKIGGFMWRDRNKDGVKDAGETRLGGRKVYLLDANSNILDSTTTTYGNSLGGEYLFTDLPTPATYIIQMDTPVSLCSSGSSYITIRTYDIDGILDDQSSQVLNAGDCFLLHDFGYDCIPPPTGN